MVDQVADIERALRVDRDHAMIGHDDDRRRLEEAARGKAGHQLADIAIDLGDRGFCLRRLGAEIMPRRVDPVEIHRRKARALVFRAIIPGQHLVDAVLIGLVMLIGRPAGRAQAVMRGLGTEPEHDRAWQPLLLGRDPDRFALPPAALARPGCTVEDFIGFRIIGRIRDHAVMFGIKAGCDRVEVHECHARHHRDHRLGLHAARRERVQVRARPARDHVRMQPVQADQQDIPAVCLFGLGRERRRCLRALHGAAGHQQCAQRKREGLYLGLHPIRLHAAISSRVRAPP